MAENSGITVRQATLLDLDALVPLFDGYRRFYRRPGDLEVARQFLRERLQQNQSIIFIAESAVESGGSTAVGFTQLFPSFSSASAAKIFILNDLFVKAESRRAGVGSLLLAAAADFARAAGAVRLTLSTEVSNDVAQSLYEASGWKRQTDFYVYNLGL